LASLATRPSGLSRASLRTSETLTFTTPSYFWIISAKVVLPVDLQFVPRIFVLGLPKTGKTTLADMIQK
jgi:hypothetical protein